MPTWTWAGPSHTRCCSPASTCWCAAQTPPLGYNADLDMGGPLAYALLLASIHLLVRRTAVTFVSVVPRGGLADSGGESLLRGCTSASICLDAWLWFHDGLRILLWS